jgi:hypothetical protein
MTAADQSLAELAQTSEARPFEEARKLLKRLEKADPAREVIFETGYGSSGLAHLRRGTARLAPKPRKGIGHNGKRTVPARDHAMMVNRCMVNRSAPELFPARLILKKSFTPRERRGIAPLVWTRAFSANALKINRLLSLMICPLNRI